MRVGMNHTPMGITVTGGGLMILITVSDDDGEYQKENKTII